MPEREAVPGSFQLASLRMAAVGSALPEPLDTFAGFLRRIRIGYFDDPWFLDERNVKKHGLEAEWPILAWRPGGCAKVFGLARTTHARVP